MLSRFFGSNLPFERAPLLPHSVMLTAASFLVGAAPVIVRWYKVVLTVHQPNLGRSELNVCFE
jgi:hypothetical protein